MKPRPSPTSPAAVLSDQKAKEMKNVWQSGAIQQPLKLPWGRLTMFIVLGSIVISLGTLVGLGVYVHRFPQTWITRFIPVSTTSTTVIQQGAKDPITQVPTVVQALLSSGYGIARNQGKGGMYGSADVSGYAWSLSSSGWLMSVNGAWPADATSNVLVPTLGAVLPVTSQVSDPASPYRFMKTSSLDTSPLSFAQADNLKVGARVWVVTTDIAVPRQLARLVTPHWQSSDRQDSYWLLDAPVTSLIGAAVVDNEGRLVGLLGNDGRVWSMAGVENIIKSVIQTASLVRPIAGFFAADLRAVSTAGALPTTGWMVGASDGVSGPAAKGPADKAGVQNGDIITKIDGVTPTTTPFLTFSPHSPSDSVVLTVLRSGKEKTLTVKLTSSGS